MSVCVCVCVCVCVRVCVCVCVCVCFQVALDILCRLFVDSASAHQLLQQLWFMNAFLTLSPTGRCPEANDLIVITGIVVALTRDSALKQHVLLC